MILGLSIALGVLAVGLAFWWLSVRFQARPLEPVTQWPAAPAHRSDFAGELTAIGVVETGRQPAPNYVSDEYPLVEVPAAEVAEPVQVAEPAAPVEHVARHAAVERVLSDARPWLTPALHSERSPIFHESGSFPVLDLDLSATNAWGQADRAALRELLDMPEEEAA